MPVQFEESSIQKTINSSSVKKRGAIISFLIDKNLAKDEKQANLIMIIMAVLFFGLAIAVPFIL